MNHDELANSQEPQCGADGTVAGRVSHVLLQHVRQIAEECDTAAIFVYVDALHGEVLPLEEQFPQRVFYVTKTEAENREQREHGRQFIHVPDVKLTRMAQVKVAVFLALAKGLIQPDDVVACLTGIPESGTLDSLIILEVGREFETYVQGERWFPPDVLPEVVDRVVDIASQLGSEGREGKPVGAIFVVGDLEQVRPLSRQLILNPFQGYPPNERNILDPRVTETVKEFSTIDGAFLLRGDGMIESCGTLLRIAEQPEYELPRGLGSRHHAAAAITAVTDTLAVTVSESTGTVTIFRGGRILTELERSRSLNLLNRMLKHDQAD